MNRYLHSPWHAQVLLVAILPGALSWHGRARADDTVYLASPANPQSRAKVTGRITDYNGRDLVLATGGVEKRYPAAQVAEVDSDWTPTQLAADELFARREYAAALSKYEEAMRGESRRWVQRKIVAQMIWCLRNADQYRRAGDLFLALVRDDPAMLYFSCIPLRWLPAQPAADLDKKSREWLASGAPVAVLIGASHVLPTGDRGAIVKQLEQLAGDKDPRIASVATALVWNATFASAGTKQLGTWEDEIEGFPESVRGGPYFALGRAFAHHKQPQEAALNLLHVPILYPEDRTLAATALFDAGGALEQAADADAAIRVYRELLADYSQSRPAVEAQQRLKEIESKSAAGNNDGKAAK